jgi:2-iminoacetate synthase
MKNRIPDSEYTSIFKKAKQIVSKTKYYKRQETFYDKVREILANRKNSGLDIDEVGVLLHSVYLYRHEPSRELIKQTSRKLRQKLYKNFVATMVPIEISSYCSSNCDFCGWKRQNKEMLRLTISKEGLFRQLDTLSHLGFSHFEISGGDNLQFLKNDLANTIETVREKIPDYARISICLTPMQEEQYRQLKNQGLDTVLTWQETYCEEEYNHHITDGPKARGIDINYKVIPRGNGYLTRLRSQEEAIRAGLQVGIGTMLGLCTYPAEDILSLIIHGKLLIGKYEENIQPIIIGMPTWNHITTANYDLLDLQKRTLDIENDFELIAAIYLLSFPDGYCWVFPNCRVTKKIQVQSILTAGCFTSTMVRVGPGAYLNIIENFQEIFAKASSNIEYLTMEKIIQGEQFRHHFDTHKNYIKLFKKNGLEVVNDYKFLREIL